MIRREGWSFRLNATKEALEKISPYTVEVFRNGWPAGIINPHGGTMIATGNVGASENDFIEWCKR